MPSGATNGDGYGTHDWVIDQALKVVNGRANGWLDARVARLTSDDADSSGTSPGLEHVYREQGQRGGAIHRITEHYANAVRYYKLGKAAQDAGDTTTATANFRSASLSVGHISHYYADIMQPHHAAYAAVGNDDEHMAYELAVDRSTKQASDRPEWSSSSRTPKAMTNVRSMAIAAAAYSRSLYPELHQLYGPSHTFSSRVSEITGLVFKRAANDLANIIYSIPLGAGIAPPVAKLVASVKWVYPKVNEPYQQIIVTATDAAGKPIEGLGVDTIWPLSSGGTATIRIYTDPTGKNHWTRSIGTSPLMQKRTISVRATTNGVTKTASAWYMPTPVLATGLDGFRTTNNNFRPDPGEWVTVTSTVRDTSGRPVAGIPVTWTWTYTTTSVTTTAVTNSAGIATSKRQVHDYTTRNKVTIYAKLQSGSANRNSTTWFDRP